MENNETYQEWFESAEPEVDFNDLNKSQLTRYTNTSSVNVDTTDIKAQKTFETAKREIEIATANLENVYDIKIKRLSKLSTMNTNITNNTSKSILSEITNLSNTTTAINNEKHENHPVNKFKRILNELTLIEKDLKYFKENKDKFQGKYSLDKAGNEFNSLKNVCDIISNSDSYKIINEIKTKNPDLDKDKYSLLNKKIYDVLNDQIVNRVKVINYLKGDKSKQNNTISENVNYELYLTPDTKKVRLFTKMIEIKRSIGDIEQKIGNWDIKSKKVSISEVLNLVKNNLRLFDKEYQKEITTKMNTLNTRLTELQEGNEEFYNNEISKPKIDELYKNFVSAKKVEDLIFMTVNRLESLKNGHEESAYIFVKLKEVLDQQDKIEKNIVENAEALNDLDHSMQENVKMMRNNIDSIRERFKKLKK